MATTDTELITEARAITDYDTSILSDAEMQELVDIGKEEIELEYPLTDDLFPGFYNGDLEIDRALFWFVCVAAKVKVGELGGLDINAGSFLDVSPHSSSESFALQKFQQRMKGVAVRGGMAQETISRASERTYGDQ